MYPHEVMTTQYPTHAAANVVHTFMALEVGVQPSELTAPTLVFGNPRDRVILSPHFPHMLEPIFLCITQLFFSISQPDRLLQGGSSMAREQRLSHAQLP